MTCVRDHARPAPSARREAGGGRAPRLARALPLRIAAGARGARPHGPHGVPVQPRAGRIDPRARLPRLRGPLGPAGAARGTDDARAVGAVRRPEDAAAGALRVGEPSRLPAGLQDLLLPGPAE